MEERVPLVMDAGRHNADYLATKRDKLGHLFIDGGACTVLALAVSGDSSHWPDLRLRAEALAREQDLTLEPLHASRLLALWERPQFVWKLLPGTVDPGPLLKAMARWPETRRLGLMRVASERTALHPPQTLERVDCALDDLKLANAEIRTFDEPCLIHWQTSS